MTHNQPAMIEMLAMHEEAIGGLYDVYASLFPSRAGFWTSMAADESRHAAWLRELGGRPAVVEWFEKESGLSRQPIEISIEYVRKAISAAEAGGVTDVEALSIARDIEKALLESRFSRLRGSTPPEARSFVANLVRETQRHFDSVMEYIESQMQSGA